jgi:hypothetical protein
MILDPEINLNKLREEVDLLKTEYDIEEVLFFFMISLVLFI